MISVIIPAYNAEEFLASCLESLMEQKYEDWEAVIVDDGSKDGTYKLAEKYADKDCRIKVIWQENAGPGAARNRGIDEARGEWITFVDADDIIAHGYFERLATCEEDIVFFSNTTFRGEVTNVVQRCLLKDNVHVGRENVEQEILPLKENEQKFEFYGYTWNKRFRRDIIIKNGIRFQPRLIFREDEVFTSEYMRYVQSMRTISTPLYYYRKLSGSLTTKKMQSKDFMQLACLVESTLDEFANRELKRYELFRILYMLYDALLSARSIDTVWRISKEIHRVTDKYTNEIPVERLPWNMVKDGKRSMVSAFTWCVKRKIKALW